MAKKTTTPARPRNTSKKTVDTEAVAEVQSVETQDTPATVGVEGDNNSNNTQETNVNDQNIDQTEQPTEGTVAVFQFRKAAKNGSHFRYSIPGRQGVLLLGKQFIAEGAEPPATLEIPSLVLPELKLSERASKAKLTKEERKALRDAMTPAQRLEAQEARLRRQQENLAKRRAALDAAAANL